MFAALVADIAAEIGAAADAMPALPDKEREVLRQAFAEPNATPRLLRHALRAASGALALGQDPMPAIRQILEPQGPAIEVGFPRGAHPPR